MSISKRIQHESEQLVARHGKLIRFLCLRASYGQDIYYRDLLQECYLMLISRMEERKPGMSELRERAWVYWCCRDAIARFRNNERRSPSRLPAGWLPATRVAPCEVTQNTIDDLASCLNGAERLCFLRMAAGVPDAEIEKEFGITHHHLLQLRHTIKKKLQQYIQQ